MMEIKNLTVAYPDGTTAVNNFSCTIASGETVALIGANGAGKTSLMLTLVGVLPVKSGGVTVDGVTLEKKSLNDIRRRVGLVFQNPDDQLFMPLIRDDVAFGPRNFGLTPEEVEKQVEKALKSLEISHLRDRSSLKLSGGEKRMAAIATVLAMEPQVMLFDEPTAFLDPRARRNLINVLRGLPHAKLIALHDLNFAAEVCDSVLIMKGGELFAQGSTELLYDAELMDGCGLEAITAVKRQ